ncbi:MAG: sulfate ABC transporter substrate-binding protein [Pirellulales bacterium]
MFNRVGRRHVLTMLGLLLVGAGCQPADQPSGSAGNAGTSPAAGSTGSGTKPASVTLLNVSYDPTREFYQEFNRSFADYWQQQHGQSVTIEQSHGGAGKQARAVIDGLEADVVTLALGYDIDAIADKAQLVPADWQQRLPHHSAPYNSTIVFLVRKGNPKGIKDWGDLVRGDVSIITPNPKTSGGARLNYLAAWGYILAKELGGVAGVAKATPEQRQAADQKAREFVAQIFQRVPVLDSGARGATNTFIQRELGDVLLTWENEAFLALKDAGPDKVEMVVPSLSILAEPPVTWVDKVTAKHGTTEVAQAYLQHLYSPQGQQLAAKHFFRPTSPESVSEEQRQQFAQLDLFRLEDLFGEWRKVQAEHFDDGGVFDQIYQPGK